MTGGALSLDLLTTQTIVLLNWYRMHFKFDFVTVFLNLCHKTERRGNSPTWLLFRHCTNELKETVISILKTREKILKAFFLYRSFHRMALQPVVEPWPPKENHYFDSHTVCIAHVIKGYGRGAIRCHISPAGGIGTRMCVCVLVRGGGEGRDKSLRS